MVHVVEKLPSNLKALSSNPSTAKKIKSTMEKKKKRRFLRDRKES
jgi:hypothetical protein